MNTIRALLAAALLLVTEELDEGDETEAQPLPERVLPALLPDLRRD